MAPSPYIAPFNLIGQEVPTSYVHVEQLIRQLRLKVQQNPRDGERPAFFTLTELREGLSKHLQDLSISDTTFSAALKFLHEVGDDVYRARDQQIYRFYSFFQTCSLFFKETYANRTQANSCKKIYVLGLFILHVSNYSE